MTNRKDYPIISIFIDKVYPVSEDNSNEEDISVDASLQLSCYSMLSGTIREKSLHFGHELIKYFTTSLILHHYQDEVPIFTVFLRTDGSSAYINTHGNYYSNFIRTIPLIGHTFNDLLHSIIEDININKNNIEDILTDLENSPRIDTKPALPNDESVSTANYDLDWIMKRRLRTQSSEVYELYLNDENAGEIHIHIGKQINATIIITVDITDKEKAQLMGLIHETLLEPLEENLDTNSTIGFFSEAEVEI